jgi:hypothetical protein
MPRLAGLALVALGCPGCLTGLVYFHVTVPLDVNFDETPVHAEQARDSWNTFQYYVRFDWGSDGLGDVAKRHGFARVHYADLETLTVLGIWTQRYAHVYGELEQPRR